MSATARGPHRSRRTAALAAAAALVLVTATVLAWRPGWREYVAEVVVAVLLLAAGRELNELFQARLPRGRASMFDEAARQPATPLRIPGQFSSIARGAAVLGGPTSSEQRELLATTARRRLAHHHGCELESERARVLLGPHVHDLLLGASPVLTPDDARIALDALEGL